MGKSAKSKVAGAKARRRKAPAASVDLSGEDLSYIAADLRALARPIGELSEFAFDPDNANEHSEESIAACMASLAQFGQRKNVVVNVRTKRYEAGEGTVRAALRLGWKFIAMARVDDDDKTARAFAIADNRAAELSTWNQDRLADQLPQVQEDFSQLFDELLLDELAGGGQESAPETKTVEVTQKFGLYVELGSEKEQQGLYERLKREGLSVKVLTI